MHESEYSYSVYNALNCFKDNAQYKYCTLSLLYEKTCHRET